MTLPFVTCGDNPDEEKETNFSSIPEGLKGKVLLLFLTHKVAPYCLELDVAPEITRAPGTLHLRKTTGYYLTRKGKDLGIRVHREPGLGSQVTG